MKHRDFSLDLIRILACLMVVLTHSPLPSADEHSVLLAGVSLFTIPCNALFFMVSGALLLPPLLRMRLCHNALRAPSWASGWVRSWCPCSSGRSSIW